MDRLRRLSGTRWRPCFVSRSRRSSGPGVQNLSSFRQQSCDILTACWPQAAPRVWHCERLRRVLLPLLPTGGRAHRRTRGRRRRHYRGEIAAPGVPGHSLPRLYRRRRPGHAAGRAWPDEAGGADGRQLGRRRAARLAAAAHCIRCTLAHLQGHLHIRTLASVLFSLGCVAHIDGMGAWGFQARRRRGLNEYTRIVWSRSPSSGWARVSPSRVDCSK